jgi:hypothetical protein
MTTEESSPKKPTEASVLARLEGLKGDPRRPQTALLAEHLESIERSLARGVPRRAIWEALREEGFTMTFKSFETFLHRLRKRKSAQQGKTPQRPEAPKSTVSNSQAVLSSAQPTASLPKPETNIPVEKSELAKKQEAYKSFKESLPDHLSIRERTKQQEAWKKQNELF